MTPQSYQADNLSAAKTGYPLYFLAIRLFIENNRNRNYFRNLRKEQAFLGKKQPDLGKKQCIQGIKTK